VHGYFATAAHLHEAIVGTEIDDDLVDHTGRLLKIMVDCAGRGRTLEHFPPGPIVLAVHAAHLGQQTPSVSRYIDAVVIADHLVTKAPEKCGCSTEQRDHIVQQYLAILNRQDWCDIASDDLDWDNDFRAWFAANIAARLYLRAFMEMTDGDDR
jgi:hypothetical protein